MGASAAKDLYNRGALDAARRYWNSAFAAQGIRAGELGGAESIEFARRLPDGDLKTLVPEKNKVIPPDLVGLKGSGCLLSLDEVRSVSNVGMVTEHVDRFLSEDPMGRTEAEWAISVVREIFDIVRRYKLAKAVSEGMEIPFAEVLGLYRREGAFALTPPGDSYGVAPLIDTERDPNDCRVGGVVLDVGQEPRSEGRTGFVLRLRKKLAPTGMVPAALLARANLLAVGGADELVVPRLLGLDPREPSGYVDELVVFAVAMVSEVAKTEPEKTLLREWGSFPSVVGLMWAALEQRHPQRVEETEIFELFLETLDRVRALISAHPRLDSVDDPALHFLNEDQEATGTSLCLQGACQWYASRRMAITLLPRGSRGVARDPAAVFSPFASYLRYNVGDITFVGILLRLISEVRAVQSKGTATWRTAPPEHRAAMEHAVEVLAPQGVWATQQLIRWRRLPSGPRLASEQRWHNVGLSTKAGTNEQVRKELERIGAIVVTLLDHVVGLRALAGLCAILEWSPADVLTTETKVMAGITSEEQRLEVLSKCHSFARLVSFYERHVV